MLRKAIISSIHFEDANSRVNRGIATLFRIKRILETDPIPSIQPANNREEITTLPDSKEGKLRSKEAIFNVNLISHSDFTQKLTYKQTQLTKYQIIRGSFTHPFYLFFLLSILYPFLRLCFSNPILPSFVKSSSIPSLTPYQSHSQQQVYTRD